jgi:hypothetical protein
MKPATPVANFTYNPLASPAWDSLPHFFPYEYVVVVTRRPMYLPVALLVRGMAGVPEIFRRPFFNVAEKQALRYMHGQTVTKRRYGLSDFVTDVRLEFGHVAMFVCENGRPVAALGESCLVGFHPFYLTATRTNGEFSYQYPKQERVKHLIRYDRVVEGCVSDDDDPHEPFTVSSCVRFKLTRAQLDAFPDVVESYKEKYHCWGKRWPNCAVVATAEVPRRLRITAADKFVARMPHEADWRFSQHAREHGRRSEALQQGVVCLSREHVATPFAAPMQPAASLVYN